MSTTPESEAVVVAAEVVFVLYPSDMKDTGLGSLMVCESEMGESDLEPDSGVAKCLCCILAERASRLVTTLAVLMTGSCFVVAGTFVPLTRPAPDVSICVASNSARCFELTAVLGYGGGGGRISAPPPRAGAGDGLGGGTGVRDPCCCKENS